MKVAFDENVPPLIAKVFLALVDTKQLRRKYKDITLHLAKDFAPKTSDRDYIKNSDVPWLDRFAASGGRAVISGDVQMRTKHHEKLALYQNGFVTIFFERQCGQWNFYHRSALMLYWWEEIMEKIYSADRGTFWVIPASWPEREKKQLRNVSIGLAKLLKDNPSSAQNRKRTRPKGAYKKNQTQLEESKQAALDLVGGASGR